MAKTFEKDGVKIGLLAAEEPPPKVTGNRDRINAVRAVMPLLREQKKTWFRIGEFPKKSSAGTTAQRLRKQYPDFEWEARSSEKGSVLWGRHK